MVNCIKITDLTAPELDVYARRSERQLLNRDDPAKGLFIAESPLVIGRALDAGYRPVSCLLEEGDAERACAFLGHPYAMEGTVRHGRGIGKTQLVPTVNLLPQEGKLVPRFGVYATRVLLPDGGALTGVTNVGVRPTVGGEGVTVETFLLDFSGDLYGQTLRVEFHRFLRPERRFASTRELHDMIARNADEARAYFA